MKRLARCSGDCWLSRAHVCTKNQKTHQTWRFFANCDCSVSICDNECIKHPNIVTTTMIYVCVCELSTIYWKVRIAFSFFSQYFSHSQFSFLFIHINGFDKYLFHVSTLGLDFCIFIEISRLSSLIHIPPVHSIDVPLIYLLLSLAKKTITSATSLGNPNRRSDMLSMTDCFISSRTGAVIGVWMKPGITAFTRKPYWANSFEAVFVIASTPALLAE